MAGPSAEGDSNAEFVSLECDGVGDDAEDADGHEDESDGGEDTESDEEEAGASVVIVIEKSANRSCVAESQVGVDGGNFGAKLL